MKSSSLLEIPGNSSDGGWPGPPSYQDCCRWRSPPFPKYLVSLRKCLDIDYWVHLQVCRVGIRQSCLIWPTLKLVLDFSPKYYQIQLPKMLLRWAISNWGRSVCWGSRRLTLLRRPPPSSATVGLANICRLNLSPFRQQSGFRLSIRWSLSLPASA